MKLNFAFILSIFFGCFAGACCKESIPDPNPCPIPCDTISNGKLEILWMVPLRQDTSQGSSRYPLLDGDQVIFSNIFGPDGEEFYALDALTGQQNWHWIDNKIGGSTGRGYGLHTTGTHLIASMGSSYFIDRQAGNTDWWIYIEGKYCASVRSAMIGNCFYQNLSICQAAYDTVSILRRTPLNLSMTWDTVFVTRPAQNDEFYSDFEPPALWIHPSGDSILIMKNRMITAFFPLINRVDLWAWNLSADSLLWKIEDFDPDGAARIGPPTIYNDKAYVFGGHWVYCFDLVTAQLIWSREFTKMAEGVIDGQPVIAEGILIVKTSTRTAYGLNAESGSEIWSRPDEVGACRSLLAYYDGKVYYTGFDLHPGELYALDIHTGETIWAEPSPAKKKYSDASFAYNGVAIDPVRKVLYTSDYYFAYCIKLPQ